MTSPERGWPSPEKLVSTLLTTNKRTMRSERDSGDRRQGSVWSGPLARMEGTELSHKQHKSIEFRDASVTVYWETKNKFLVWITFVSFQLARGEITSWVSGLIYLRRELGISSSLPHSE